MAKSNSRNRAGYVYFARGLFDFYKIGKSRNPQKRIVELQRETRTSIQLVHRIASNDACWLERKFHHFFANNHCEKEWYMLSEKEINAIKMMKRHDRLRLHSRDAIQEKLDTLAGQSLTGQKQHNAAAEMLGKIGGKKGGPARAKSLTAERRSEIA